MYIQRGDGDIPYNYERKIKIILEDIQDQKRKVLRIMCPSNRPILTLYTIVNTDIRYERAHDVILSSRMNIKFYYPRVATTPQFDS